MRTRNTDTTRTQQVVTYQSDWSELTLCLRHEEERPLGMEQVKYGLHDGICDVCMITAHTQVQVHVGK